MRLVLPLVSRQIFEARIPIPNRVKEIPSHYLYGTYAPVSIICNKLQITTYKLVSSIVLKNLVNELVDSRIPDLDSEWCPPDLNID
jgi:hypothetical protein